MRNSKLPCMVMPIQTSTYFSITSLRMDQYVAAEIAKYNTVACPLHNEQGALENLQLMSQLWEHIREMRERGKKRKKCGETERKREIVHFFGFVYQVFISCLDCFPASAGLPSLATVNWALLPAWNAHCVPAQPELTLNSCLLKSCSPKLLACWQPVKGVSAWIIVCAEAEWCTLHLCHNLHGMYLKQKTEI